MRSERAVRFDRAGPIWHSHRINPGFSDGCARGRGLCKEKRLPEAGEKLFVKDIQEGREVSGQFLLVDLRLGTTKNGKPFVGLKLMDRTGQVEGRVWDRAEWFAETFSNGDAAWVRGQAEGYQGKTQVKVMDARPLDSDELDLSLLMPSSAFDPDEMLAELEAMIGAMADPHLQGLLRDVLADPDLIQGLRRAPAAKRFHHAYVGGLLEHILGVSRAAVQVGRLYPVLNADLLLTGAVLHDLGKVREFDSGPGGDYTSEGRLLGHLIIGFGMIEDKIGARPDFPPELALLVKHLILSHHGEYEMGSPRRPKILEALALHLIDDLDAKMNGIGGFIARHANEGTGWTDYNRLMERFFFRPAESGLTKDDFNTAIGAPFSGGGYSDEPAAGDQVEGDGEAEEFQGDRDGDEGEDENEPRREKKAPPTDPNQLRLLGD